MLDDFDISSAAKNRGKHGFVKIQKRVYILTYNKYYYLFLCKARHYDKW